MYVLGVHMFMMSVGTVPQATQQINSNNQQQPTASAPRKNNTQIDKQTDKHMRTPTPNLQHSNTQTLNNNNDLF